MASARDIPQVALAFDCSVALDRREALLALARERGIVAAGDTGEPPTHVLAERGDWATLAARNAADIARGAKLVLPSWLEAVCKLSILPDSRMHSPDATKVFAGTVICTTGLSADQDRLVQLILLEFGGAHRTSLTREVTHLLATTAKSDKYYRAVKYGATVGISIVRPHWLFASFAAGQLQSVEPYGQPTPLSEALLTEALPSMSTLSEQLDNPPRPLDRRTVRVTVPLDGCVRDAIGARVLRAGAVRYVATDRPDELARADPLTIVVCKDRSSPCYAPAVAAGCVVVGMRYLLAVLASGIAIDPAADILHRVCPPPSAALSSVSITVGSYREAQRARAVELITELGATFSGSANATTSVYVLPSDGVSSAKGKHASANGKPIVTIDWLEASLEAGAAVPFAAYHPQRALRRTVVPSSVADISTRPPAPLRSTQEIALAECTCAECLGLAQQAVLLSCDHIYCKACIDRTFATFGPSCPYCRSQHMGPIRPAPRPLLAIIQQLQLFESRAS